MTQNKVGEYEDIEFIQKFNKQNRRIRQKIQDNV